MQSLLEERPGVWDFFIVVNPGESQRRKPIVVSPHWGIESFSPVLLEWLFDGCFHFDPRHFGS